MVTERQLEFSCSEGSQVILSMYSSLLDINQHHGPKEASEREKNYHLHQLLHADLLEFQQLNDSPPIELNWTLHHSCKDCCLLHILILFLLELPEGPRSGHSVLLSSITRGFEGPATCRRGQGELWLVSHGSMLSG